MTRALTSAIAVAFLVIVTGCGVGGNDSGVDWEQRRGSDWSEYESAYKASWRTGCERASEVGHGLEEKVAPPDCDPAAAPDDPPDVPPLNPDAAGRIDGFVAGLVSGCAVLRTADRNKCIALGGEK